jgi:hypothetical protein
MLPAAWQQQHTQAPLQQQRPGIRHACSRSGLTRSLARASVHATPHVASKSSSRQLHVQLLQRTLVGTAAASISSCAGTASSLATPLLGSRRSSHCCSSLPLAAPSRQQLNIGSRQQQRSAHIARAGSQPPPDPWQQPPGAGAATDWSGGGSSGKPPGGYGPPSGNGRQSPTASYDAWEAAAPQVPANGRPRYEQTDWGWSGRQQAAGRMHWSGSIQLRLCRHSDVASNAGSLTHLAAIGAICWNSRNAVHQLGLSSSNFHVLIFGAEPSVAYGVSIHCTRSRHQPAAGRAVVPKVTCPVLCCGALLQARPRNGTLLRALDLSS